MHTANSAKVHKKNNLKTLTQKKLPMEERLFQPPDVEQKIRHVYLCHLQSAFYRNSWLVAYLLHPIQQEDMDLFALATAIIM